jgi:hypothetical protein
MTRPRAIPARGSLQAHLFKTCLTTGTALIAAPPRLTSSRWTAERRAHCASKQSPVASDPTRELFRTLAALDRDLIEHIHWESDVLFVRAVALEA